MTGARDPEPPTDVRVVYDDGRDVAVSCVYSGDDSRGHAVWTICDAPDGRPVAIKIGKMPPRSSVVFA